MIRHFVVFFSVSYLFGGILFAESLLSKSLQPVDKLLCHSGSLSLGVRWKCQNLDELGGQPPVTIAITQEAKTWADKNFPVTPRYYLSTIPKRGLSQDILMKQRQDKIMERLHELRTLIIDATTVPFRRQ